MQLSTICTECKEMFLFTDDHLCIRPITHYSEKIRPICFRCSTTVGACISVAVRVTEMRLKTEHEDEGELLDIDDCIKKYGILTVQKIVMENLARMTAEEADNPTLSNVESRGEPR